MIDILRIIGLEGLVLAFLASLIAIVQIFKFIVKKKNSTPLSESNSLVKKYDEVNLERYTSFFRMLGLSIVMLTVLAAFEYPSSGSSIMELEHTYVFEPDDIDSAFILPEPKVPQKVKAPPVIKIVEVDNQQEIEDIDIDIPEDIDENEPIEEYVFVEEKDEEPIDDFVLIAEKAATYKGGMTKFYKWLSKKIKYPGQAKRMGVEGRVFVEFIVERDGSLSNLKVVRGIGAGCDEEAIRILKLCPNWNPGEQRGRPVRQKMVLPISFRLN